MTREELLISAEKLERPIPQAVTEFAARQDALLAELNRRMPARTDLDRLIGADNCEMMENNSQHSVVCWHQRHDDSEGAGA